MAMFNNQRVVYNPTFDRSYSWTEFQSIYDI